MRRRLLIILLLALSAPLWALDVPCGSVIELRATPADNWHFERWSDGDTQSVRQIEVRSDLNLVAYFAPNCTGYTLPVAALYDWLLMLDMRTIQENGYFFGPEEVNWYRVRGVIDAIDLVEKDDEWLAKGYYLTLDQSLAGTGDYYAIVDLSSTPSGTCANKLLSELVHFTSSAAPTPVLEPTMVRANEPQQLLRLNPAAPTSVAIFDISGRLVQTLTAENVERLSLRAAPLPGCYQVLIRNGNQQTVLRYIVVK